MVSQVSTGSDYRQSGAGLNSAGIQALRYEQPILDFGLIKEGLPWWWAKTVAEGIYERLYDGDFHDLWTHEPSVENGLSLLGSTDDVIGINYFRTVVDFYVDYLFTVDPRIASDNKERQAFIDEHARGLIDGLEEAMHWRGVKGRFVVGVEEIDGENRVRGIDPSSYFPVTPVYTRYTTKAHILAYPYSFRNDGKERDYTPTPNYIRFCFYSEEEGINEIRIHKYSPYAVGALESVEPSNVKFIGTFGRGPADSLFVPIIDPLREIMLRRTLGSYVINKHVNPHMQAPPNAQPSFQKLGDLIEAGESVLLPLPSMGGEYKYLIWDGNLESNEQEIEALWDVLATMTGVAPQAYGVHSGRQQSALSKERDMHAASAKIARWRKDISGLIPKILDAMGAPPGNTVVTFAEDPFEPWLDKIGAAKIMADIGYFSAGEIRARVGYSSKLPDDVKEMMDMKKEMMMNPSQEGDNTNEGEDAQQ